MGRVYAGLVIDDDITDKGQNSTTDNDLRRATVHDGNWASRAIIYNAKYVYVVTMILLIAECMLILRSVNDLSRKLFSKISHIAPGAIVSEEIEGIIVEMEKNFKILRRIIQRSALDRLIQETES